MIARCTLSASELVTRASRWRALAPTLVESRQLAYGRRLVFRSDPGIEATLRDLAGLEADCCGFADWSVHADGDRVMLDVTATDDDSVAAVHSMFERLTAARAEA